MHRVTLGYVAIGPLAIRLFYRAYKDGLLVFLPTSLFICPVLLFFWRKYLLTSVSEGATFHSGANTKRPC